MSWIHSSKALVLAGLLAVALVTVGTAAALSVQGDTPEPAAVGDSVTYQATIEEPFRDAPNAWELQGSTELENATWTVEVLAQGDPVNTSDFGGQTFTYGLDRENGATVINIEVSGDVPDIGSFNYEKTAQENYTVLSVARLSDGTENELATFRGHRYTEASRQARTAIDDAITAVGSRNDKIDQAISSYDNANFENARSLANEAESGAQSSQLLMIGAGVVVVLALVGGGVYYWRQRSQSDYKLQ